MNTYFMESEGLSIVAALCLASSQSSGNGNDYHYMGAFKNASANLTSSLSTYQHQPYTLARLNHLHSSLLHFYITICLEYPSIFFALSHFFINSQ